MRKIVLVMLCMLASAVEAQAPKSFAEGVLAFEKGEWAKAERLMRETIAGNPNESEGTVSISGSWFETYVPHYFLARALARQGKCAEALRAFAETERQGITPAIPDFARHLRTRGGCKPQASAPKEKKVIKEVVVPFGEEEVVPATTTTTATTVPDVVTTTRRPESPPLQPDERAPLAKIVAAYLEGRYEEAVRLSQRQFRDRAAAGEAALFRAAARDALQRINGDEALQQQIESDLRTYRSLRPNGRPDPRIFTPRFIAMVSGVRRP